VSSRTGAAWNLNLNVRIPDRWLQTRCTGSFGAVTGTSSSLMRILNLEFPRLVSLLIEILCCLIKALRSLNMLLHLNLLLLLVLLLLLLLLYELLLIYVCILGSLVVN